MWKKKAKLDMSMDFKRWDNLKIGSKISIGFGFLSLMALIIGGIAIINMSRIQDETNTLAHESLPSVNESFRAD